MKQCEIIGVSDPREHLEKWNYPVRLILHHEENNVK